MLYTSIFDMIGNTPLLEPVRYIKKLGVHARLLLKIESANPAGSVKDRAALEMILQAEQDGILHEGSVIIEPTSGNTGIGLAAVAARKGYRLILTMPETMSVERRKLLSAYGAEVILTPAAFGMRGSIEKAQELASSLPDSFIPNQFSNPANAAAHEKTTGPEIWKDTEGHIDIFVAGVGTGGTLSGIGKYLRSKKQDIRIVAVEPADSPLLSEGRSGPHGLQGIGANFVPDLLDRSLIDEIFTVTTEQAYCTARALVHSEGILSGISSGAALYAATQLALQDCNLGKTIVALLPDTGDRYLSTDLFSE